MLTATPWPFGYADEETELRARAPLIALTADGRITAVRLNNRSMGPLRLPVVGRERTGYTGPDELVERASLRPPLFR